MNNNNINEGQEGYVMSSGQISGSARNILLSFKVGTTVSVWYS